jgi:hypothetical protein
MSGGPSGRGRLPNAGTFRQWTPIRTASAGYGPRTSTFCGPAGTTIASSKRVEAQCHDYLRTQRHVAAAELAVAVAGTVTWRLRAAFVTTRRWISCVVTEHRKAHMAVHAFEVLELKSEIELAKLGLERKDIARHVKERLYSD